MLFVLCYTFVVCLFLFLAAWTWLQIWMENSGYCGCEVCDAAAAQGREEPKSR